MQETPSQGTLCGRILADTQKTLAIDAALEGANVELFAPVLLRSGLTSTANSSITMGTQKKFISAANGHNMHSTPTSAVTHSAVTCAASSLQGLLTG
jgi:hypothetical protein